MSRSRSLVVATDGDLIVERDPERPSGRLLWQADMASSYVDLADPRYLDFDYMRWARLVLHAFKARHVLHVGGAACALARALLAEDPGSRHEVFEVDERVLEISRAHMGLRRHPALRLRVADGRAALETRAGNSADAIMIDAFVGARVPRHLATVEALAECARIAPLTVVNVVDTTGRQDARPIAAGLSATQRYIGGIGAGSRRKGNFILFGSAQRPDLRRLESAAAADAATPRLLRSSDLDGSAPWSDDEIASLAGQDSGEGGAQAASA